MKNIILLLVFPLVFVGCLSVGNLFDTKHIPDIEKGKTNQQDIQKWFGNPSRLGVDDGEVTWSYTYLKASVFSEAIAKDLTVYFDEDGYVTSFSFSTTEDELELWTDSNDSE